MNPHDRDLIAKLQDDPGWKALEKHVLENRERVFLNLTQKLMAGGKHMKRQDLLDDALYARGYIRGQLELIGQPTKALNDIKREATDGESHEA